MGSRRGRTRAVGKARRGPRAGPRWEAALGAAEWVCQGGFGSSRAWGVEQESQANRTLCPHSKRLAPPFAPQISSVEEADRKMAELASQGKIDPAFLQITAKVGHQGRGHTRAVARDWATCPAEAL